MKKSLLLITSLALSFIVLAGCTETNMAITTSKDLNKNLTILSNTVNRLDSVDNAYLVNEDLYVMDSLSADKTSINNDKFSNITRLASSNSVILDNDLIINENNSIENLRESLTNEIIDRLYCDSEGNCKLCKETFICNNDGVCTNCNETIICDDNGNCKTCNESLCLDNDNNCTNCKTKSTTSTCENKLADNIKNKLINISANNKELIATKLSNVNNSENKTNQNNTILEENADSFIVIDDNMYIDNVNNIAQDKQIQAETTNNTNINSTSQNDNILEENNEITNTDNTVNQNNNINDDANLIRIIYYSSDDFSPEIIKYSPRHISSINYNSASNQLENYINKVQKLYTMTADVVEANNRLGNRKTTILGTIEETKKLNNCIMNGECSPNENQVDALKNYIVEMKNTINNIRDCNGELTNEINKISNANNGLSQSIDVVSSNYLKILNQLDTRISYHENAIATLEQIKYLLEDSINNNTQITDKEETPIIERLPENNIDNNVKEDNSIIEDNTTNLDEDNPTTIKPEGDENNNTTIVDNEDTLVNNDINTEEIDDTNDIADNSTQNNTPAVEDNLDNKNNTEIITENESEGQSDITNVVEENTTHNNTDSYKENTVGKNNIDTLSRNTNNVDDIKNKNIINDTIINDNINNTTVNSITNKPTMISTNENSTLYGNTGYANSIISDNNIGEKEIGNSSYRYDEDGKLYNNTNGFNTNSEYNINNKNNNVNTYKYNTMVDTINRGTVNNGINTL